MLKLLVCLSNDFYIFNFNLIQRFGDEDMLVVNFGFSCYMNNYSWIYFKAKNTFGLNLKESNEIVAC